MALIEPLPPEEIRDPELRALIERGEALGVPDALFGRILARVPGHAKALLRALLVSHAEGAVDHRLKEAIRVMLARIAGDPYFGALRSRRALREGLDEATIAAACGDFERDPRFGEAEKWALAYARRLYLEPERVDAAFYEEGKRHYTEAQIMEIGAFAAFHYGMQRFVRTLGAAPLRARGEGEKE
jgi:alkylhydroperoxidase family enzyme